MTTAQLFHDCRCTLGEGPFWHPLRQKLFWFDILGKTMHAIAADGSGFESWAFPGFASAGAVLDRDSMAVATEHGIVRIDLDSGHTSAMAVLEPDKPGNRSNDARLHQSGAWWIGTMSKRGGKDPGAGAVYHFFRGRITRLLAEVTISNSICFSPDGTTGYFSDTNTKKIIKCQLDPATGLPVGEWSLFSEATDGRGSPDGSVVDTAGYLWNARFGGHCVVRYSPDGQVDRMIEVPVGRVTCPAFGGPDLKTLFITTARENATAEELSAEPTLGSLFSLEVDVPGQRDPILAV